MYVLSNNSGNFGQLYGVVVDLAAIQTLRSLSAALDPRKYGDYDVVPVSFEDKFSGSSIDVKNKLFIIDSDTYKNYLEAIAAASVVNPPELTSADLTNRTNAYRSVNPIRLTSFSIGTVADVKQRVEQARAVLDKSEKPDGLSASVKIALAAGIGAVVLGGGYLIIRRRRRRAAL